MQKGKTVAGHRTPVLELQFRMVPIIVGPALITEEEEQAEEENRRKSKTTEVIGAFSQLCVYLGGILSSCSNSLHKAGSVHCKAATSGSSCSKAGG